jgi:hypothetical protein
MNAFKEDNGMVSSVRIGYFIKLAVGILAMGYCIYKQWITWPMVTLIGGLFGINEVTKVVSKKLEK